jgi:perosamine synthetase
VIAHINSIAGDIALVVDDAGVLKGLVTDGDVRRAILRGIPLSATAGDFMTTSFTSGRADADPTENLVLLNQKIRHLPLLDAAGRPVEILSWANLWRLPLVRPSLGGNEMKYVSDCIGTGWISSQGAYVDRFERAFEKYMGEGHALCVSSGTAALHVALVALGIGPGDEVVVPDLTFGATANVVIHAGATPVFVDVEASTLTLSPSALDAAITARTKAVIPVHLYGHPCDMDPILEIAHTRKLKVIEDCAEALGAEYKGRKVGTLGDVGCFSFFANKVITTGEGGMIITNDGALRDKIALLRDHGMSKDRRYWHLYPGYNYRMTNLQAAVGLAQLEQIDRFLANRMKLVERYSHHLKRIDGLQPPAAEPWAKNIYWLYTVAVVAERFGLGRDAVLDGLTVQGIEARKVFFPLHDQPAYHGGRACPAPVAMDFAKRGLSLPMSNDMTLSEVDRVCDVLGNLAHTQRVFDAALP